MERHTQILGIGGIYAILAQLSNRPRYAFLVLQLVSEVADECGQAGPYVQHEGRQFLLRDWLCAQLLPLSEQPTRRAALRKRVASALKDQLTGDPTLDDAIVNAAVEEQVLVTGRTNVSRATSDLVHAGLLSRHYAGYATNHQNRGGGRHAVYVVSPQALRLLRRPAPSGFILTTSGARQEDLFAI